MRTYSLFSRPRAGEKAAARPLPGRCIQKPPARCFSQSLPLCESGEKRRPGCIFSMGFIAKDTNFRLRFQTPFPIPKGSKKPPLPHGYCKQGGGFGRPFFCCTPPPPGRFSHTKSSQRRGRIQRAMRLRILLSYSPADCDFDCLQKRLLYFDLFQQKSAEKALIFFKNSTKSHDFFP